MNEILTDAHNYKVDTLRRAVAHELSAESHRKKGVLLGLASTALTAIVGTSIFSIAVSHFGFDGKGHLTIPQETGPLILFYAIIILSLISPVLSAWHTYLNEPDQVARHSRSSADYYLIKNQLDGFIREYEFKKPTDENRQSAITKLIEISNEMTEVQARSIPITDEAYADADADKRLHKVVHKN